MMGSVHLLTLLGRNLTSEEGDRIGRLEDVIVRLRGPDYPLVSGLVGRVGKLRVFLPAHRIGELADDKVVMTSAKTDLRPFERRHGEVLLREDILGHRLIDVVDGRLVRAADLELDPREDGWQLRAVDTHGPARWWRRTRRRPAGGARDWKEFEPLLGHAPSATTRAPFRRLRRLKPAQIADLLEAASKEEGDEILEEVHGDPELEADVFEELDTDTANRLFGGRSDDEVAGIIARMRADDAADAIADLPQERRQPVLDALPPTMRTKVLVLLGFNPSTAGGLMGMEMLALPRDETVGHALAVLREARADQPEALTTIYTTDGEGRLTGAVPLLALVQSDPATVLGDLADEQAVCVGPESDVADVALLMADYNLVSIPVVDAEDRLIGLITVDDVLEVTIPEDWRRRQPGPHPEHPHPSESPLPSEA